MRSARGFAEADQREGHVDRRDRGGALPTAGRRGREHVRRPPGILPRGADAHAVGRLGHQERGLASGIGVERQVPAGRQRGVCRIDPVRRTGRRAAARLRGRVNRHWSLRHRRGVGSGPSGEGEGLRLSRGTRNRSAQQNHDHELLRHGSPAFVLHWLLRRWSHGVPGSAALPRRLRRDSGGRACLRPREREPRLHDEVQGDAREPRQHDPAEQVPGDPSRGARRLRRRGRLEGRPDRRSIELPFRSEGTRVQHGRRAHVPDNRAGRSGAEDLCRDEESKDGRADLSRTRTRQRTELDRGRKWRCAARRRQRRVQVRPVPGSGVGSANIRSGEGLRQDPQARHAGLQPDVGRPQAVRGAWRQVAHLSRLGRSQRLPAIAADVLRPCREDNRSEAGG